MKEQKKAMDNGQHALAYELKNTLADNAKKGQNISGELYKMLREVHNKASASPDKISFGETLGMFSFDAVASQHNTLFDMHALISAVSSIIT